MEKMMSLKLYVEKTQNGGIAIDQGILQNKV